MWLSYPGEYNYRYSIMYIIHVPNEHIRMYMHIGVVTEHVYIIYVCNVSMYVCTYLGVCLLQLPFLFLSITFIHIYVRSSCVEVKCTNPQALIQKLMIDRVRLIGGEG